MYIGDEEGDFTVLWDSYAAGYIMEGEYARIDFISYPGGQVKVIGNIFENPELKEEQYETD
ncbi:MAG: hypothetical protein HFI88_10175 [Lachnospiraceae bacterium]|nr:hypothetical protein [Lachnospiraceae bacterium]